MEKRRGNTQEKEKKWNKIFVAGTKIQVELFERLQKPQYIQQEKSSNRWSQFKRRKFIWQQI